MCTPPTNSHGVNAEIPVMYGVSQSSHLSNWCEAFQRTQMTRLKVGRTHALIVGLLPLPPCIEGPALAPVIMVDG